MKTNITTLAIIAVAAGMTPITASAQSAVDAMQLTQPDFKGTARFMGMGGAFTALGGDMSAIIQNPAGIGIYRSSEIAATMDIDIQSTKAEFGRYSEKNNQTKVYCNNFGYVGTTRLNGELKTFSWGVSYNRAASFDRLVSGTAPRVNTSLTNYIANFTNGANSQDLSFSQGYNPYLDSDNDWLSILGYTSYMINNVPRDNSQYQGLFNNDTESDMLLRVHEKGYIDNYEFNFGGNISNVVYWGLGIGINDLRYTRYTTFSESMDNATISSATTSSGLTNGKAEYYLDNHKLLTGTGWNLSFGLIVKPVQMLRIGASIQSPTWYNIDHEYYGYTDFSYTEQGSSAETGAEDTDLAYFSWRLRSPWRFNLGAALVIGSDAIVSVDYERQVYNDMTMRTPIYDSWGYIDGYQDANILNQDIENYTQASNAIRVGLEYRVTPKFSARLGFNTQLTNIASEYEDGQGEIITSGTDPSFSLDKTTTYITCGLGYRFGGFYIDGAYVHKTRKSTLHPYTSYANVDAPYFDVTDNNNSVVLSIGYKF